MDIGSVQNAMIGMAIFDMWSANFDKMLKTEKEHKGGGDPLVAAAFAAFEQYSKTVETQNQAMIQGLSTYCLSPKGGVMTTEQMAPLLALNVLA